MFDNMGANEITIEDIENLLNGEDATTPVAIETEDGSQGTQTDDTPGETPAANTVTETQAFAHRLKEATTKARNEERDNIAKSLGYENYADMQKKREIEMLRDKGLDPEDVSPVVQQLVEQRLAEDPRLQELDNYRQERVNAWAQKELTELKELTDGQITSLKDVPQDVIELWKTKGSLKAAYLELRGETLIREMRAGIASGQSRGSTSHLTGPQGTPASRNANKRPFTDKEREVYKLFNPGITDEQLSKMYKEI